MNFTKFIYLLLILTIQPFNRKNREINPNPIVFSCQHSDKIHNFQTLIVFYDLSHDNENEFLLSAIAM